MSVREYIGARYVMKFADPIAWDNTRTYEPLIVVQNGGASYISKQYVPDGIDILNTDYWIRMADYNAQFETIRQQVNAHNDAIEDNTNDIQTINDILDPQFFIDNEITVAEGVDKIASALPLTVFDSEHTVEDSFTLVGEAIENASEDYNQKIDAIKNIIPASDFDDENTIKKYIDDNISDISQYIDTKHSNFSEGSVATMTFVADLPIDERQYPQSMYYKDGNLFVYAVPRSGSGVSYSTLYKINYETMSIVTSKNTATNEVYYTRGNSMSFSSVGNEDALVICGGEDGNIVFYDPTTLNYIRHVAPFNPPGRTVGQFFIEGTNAVLGYYYGRSFSPCEYKNGIVYPWGFKNTNEIGLYGDGALINNRVYFTRWCRDFSVVDCYTYYSGVLFNRIYLDTQVEVQGFCELGNGEFIVCFSDSKLYNIGSIAQLNSQTTTGWAYTEMTYQISIPINLDLLSYYTVNGMKVYTNIPRPTIPTYYGNAGCHIGGIYNNGMCNLGGSAVYFLGVTGGEAFFVGYTYATSGDELYLSSITKLSDFSRTTFSYNDANMQTKLNTVFSGTFSGDLDIRWFGSPIIPSFFNFSTTAS